MSMVISEKESALINSYFLPDRLARDGKTGENAFRLAFCLNVFSREFDYYGYRNAVESPAEFQAETAAQLMAGGAEAHDILEWITEAVDDLEDDEINRDLYDFGKSLLPLVAAFCD